MEIIGTDTELVPNQQLEYTCVMVKKIDEIFRVSAYSVLNYAVHVAMRMEDAELSMNEAGWKYVYQQHIIDMFDPTVDMWCLVYTKVLQ